MKGQFQMIILDRSQVEALIDLNAIGRAVTEAYMATSRGDVNLPPVGHITFPELGADCHIKYGHLKGDPNFVIKVATGFPDNSTQGLPTGNGMSLVMSAETGALQAILHDEMRLTDVRTGVGGAIATRCLARDDSKHVLIVGTGPQAICQIQSHIALIGDHLEFVVWGRDRAKAQAVVDAVKSGCKATAAGDLSAAVSRADIIVTATGATAPLIQSEWVTDGTHITAVGADAPGKQELETQLTARADVIAVDSKSQCLDHGEVCHAVQAGTLTPDRIVELGEVLAQTVTGRTSANQITIADLTGIAAQDIAIANVILQAHAESSNN